MPHSVQFSRKRAYSRLAAPLLAAAFVLALLALPSHARAAGNLPAQGVYDKCLVATSTDHCASRVRRLASAGFTVVQNMGALEGADLPDILAYANAAQANGVKIIWSLNAGADPAGLMGLLPKLAERCGCDTGDALLPYLVAILRAHPATWGYYLADEPTAADHDKLAAYTARIKTLDPTHPRLIMGCGNCYGGEGSVSFLSDLDVTLGSDVYPVWEQAPDQPIVTKRVSAVASGLQQVADRAGRQSVVALQAFRWGDSYYDSKATGIGPASRFPTRSEIEAQRNAAIANSHPSLILWFTLNQVIGWEPGQRPWWWEEPSDAATRWANLVGGAFAPLPGQAAQNQRPVARFTVRMRSAKRTLKVAANGRQSYDPDGRIVRYRWYATGRRRAICSKRSCSVKVSRKGRRKLKLVVTDSHGASSSRVRWISARTSRSSRS